MRRPPALAILARRACLAASCLSLSGCVATEPATRPLERPAPDSLGQRLEALSARSAGLPATPPDPAQIEAQIQRLESEKQSLLVRYTAEHPSVVLLERRIQRLRELIATATPPPSPADGKAP